MFVRQCLNRHESILLVRSFVAGTVVRRYGTEQLTVLCDDVTSFCNTSGLKSYSYLPQISRSMSIEVSQFW